MASSVAESANIHWMAWRSASGLPKVLRLRACSVDISSSLSAAPRQEVATPSRPWVSECIAILKPWPTSPSTAESGTKQSSKVNSASLIASEPMVVSTRVT